MKIAGAGTGRSYAITTTGTALAERTAPDIDSGELGYLHRAIDWLARGRGGREPVAAPVRAAK